MINAILIDDELSSLQTLQFEIEAYCPDVKILKACQNPKEGVDAIVELKPDLIFLDIEMPGMTGFELLQQFEKIDFDVIFVTAYDQFAIKAFEFNALDYLLKPVLKNKLIQAVNKVANKKDHQLSQPDFRALINNLQLQSQPGFDNIALPTGEGYEFVHVNSIIYLKGESNYTWVHLENEKKYLIAKTMKDLSSMIQFPNFFRAHKSYIANLNHVAKYVRGSGGYLVLKNGEQIPVSRAQKSGLMEILKI